MIFRIAGIALVLAIAGCAHDYREMMFPDGSRGFYAVCSGDRGWSGCYTAAEQACIGRPYQIVEKATDRVWNMQFRCLAPGETATENYTYRAGAGEHPSQNRKEQAGAALQAFGSAMQSAGSPASRLEAPTSTTLTPQAGTLCTLASQNVSGNRRVCNYTCQGGGNRPVVQAAMSTCAASFRQ